MNTRQAKKIFKKTLASMTKRQMPPYQRKQLSNALKTLKRMKSNQDFFSQSAILAVEATSMMNYITDKGIKSLTESARESKIGHLIKNQDKTPISKSTQRKSSSQDITTKTDV